MSFISLKFKAVYQSGLTNLLDDFYLPVLRKTLRYDRAAGYFRSSILKSIGATLQELIMNNGRIRLITGIEFTEEDVDQIKRGYELRRVLSNRLTELVDQMSSDSDPELLNLWWLIKHNYLDIKISVSIDQDNVQRGIYHEKFGVLEDAEGNKIVFAGSVNESANGWVHNFESFDVFRDWISGEDERVSIRERNFQSLWDDQTPGIQVLDFPEAVRDRIIEMAPDQLIPRTFNSMETKDNRIDISLRPYQLEAIESWFNAGYRGILEMATGSGKTITSLFAAKKLLNKHPRSIILILCPYTHLVDQWEKEARRVGFDPLKCYQSTNSWRKQLTSLLADYKSGHIESFCIISTMDTASSPTFLSLIEIVQDHVMILADEMHNLGSSKRRNCLLPRSPFRLGLSATPNRWMDEEGTETLFDYFGDVVYSFGLARAIEYGFLTPYFYYPVPVELTEDEWAEYEELTAKITKLLFSKDLDVKDSLERLMLKRALIANSASEKIRCLVELLKKHKNIHHTLIYTSPQLLEEVTKITKDFKLFAAKFTAEETMSERKVILDMFSSGKLDVLVAMKCLDEGVDVPSIHQAFILASSSNPKEFIQRRGRVLRKSPGKKYAKLYDFIVVPPRGVPVSNVARSLIKKELARFREFSETSRNQFEAKVQLSDIARRFSVLGEI